MRQDSGATNQNKKSVRNRKSKRQRAIRKNDINIIRLINISRARIRDTRRKKNRLYKKQYCSNKALNKNLKRIGFKKIFHETIIKANQKKVKTFVPPYSKSQEKERQTKTKSYEKEEKSHQ